MVSEVLQPTALVSTGGESPEPDLVQAPPDPPELGDLDGEGDDPQGICGDEAIPADETELVDQLVFYTELS